MKKHDGHWEGLPTSSGQVPRYQLIATLVDQSPSLLDVGCGSGELARYVNVGHYLGIDKSHHAIAAAQRGQWGVNQRFSHHDIENQTLTATWHTIVFNECLYYMSDPIEVLHRARTHHLWAGGRIVISIYQHPSRCKWWHLRRTDNRRCLEKVERYLSTVHGSLYRTDMVLPGCDPTRIISISIR